MTSRDARATPTGRVSFGGIGRLPRSAFSARVAPTAKKPSGRIATISTWEKSTRTCGATLAEGAEHGELPLPPPLTRPVLLALVARLAVVPVLLMLLAAPLIDLPTTYRLMSAMPTGLNSMVVSHAYGLDNRITAEAIAWSTAIVVLAALGSLLL